MQGWEEWREGGREGGKEVREVREVREVPLCGVGWGRGATHIQRLCHPCPSVLSGEYSQIFTVHTP